MSSHTCITFLSKLAKKNKGKKRVSMRYEVEIGNFRCFDMNVIMWNKLENMDYKAMFEV
jgi:hypothetical protein